MTLQCALRVKTHMKTKFKTPSCRYSFFYPGLELSRKTWNIEDYNYALVIYWILPYTAYETPSHAATVRRHLCLSFLSSTPARPSHSLLRHSSGVSSLCFAWPLCLALPLRTMYHVLHEITKPSGNSCTFDVSRRAPWAFCGQCQGSLVDSPERVHRISRIPTSVYSFRRMPSPQYVRPLVFRSLPEYSFP